MDNYRYLLPWILPLNNSAFSGGGGYRFFICGLACSFLFFFFVITAYTHIKGRKFSVHRKALPGMGLSALALCIGLVLNIQRISGAEFLPILNIAQGLCINSLIFFLLFYIFLSGKIAPIKKIFLGFSGAAGIAAALLPMAFNLPAYLFFGSYILLNGLALIINNISRGKSSAYAQPIPDMEEFPNMEEFPDIAAELVFDEPKTDDEFLEELAAAQHHEIMGYMVQNLDTMDEDTAAAHNADNPEYMAYKLKSFVPTEFLRLLNKKTIMDLKLGDHHEQEMTIFFSDIRQFTELFESLSTEEGFKFINSYLTRIVPVIERYGGFVDKYIGDAIMALFPQSNGADMAVQAAIMIQKQVVEYNKHRLKTGYRPLDIGIGIHTGTLMLGVVGVHNRMQNTVISDSVNLASRVENLTKAFGVSMAISGQTFQKLEHPEAYMFRYLGNVKVKGKGEPTRVYEILDGTNEDIMEKKMKTNMYFEQGLFSFVTKRFDDALKNFNKVLEILPNDQAAIIYREYCLDKVNSGIVKVAV